MPTHEKIKKLMQAMGYAADEKGVCNGVSSIIGNALLLDEKDGVQPLIQRLNLIDKYSIEEICRKVATVENKVKKGESLLLNEEENILLSLKPFFDSLIIYCDSSKYQELYETGNQPKNQYSGSDDADLRVLPMALIDERKTDSGGYVELNPKIKSVDKFTGIFEKDELKTFFELMGNKLKESKENVKFHCFGVCDGNRGHTIEIIWNAKKSSWYLIDVNGLQVTFPKGATSPKSVDENELERFLSTIFDSSIGGSSSYYKPSYPVTFSMVATTLKVGYEKTKLAMDSFREEKDIDKIFNHKAKTKLSPNEKNVFLKHAIESGDLRAIKSLVGDTIPNKELQYYDQYLMQAARIGRIEIIKFLLSARVPCDSTNPKALSAIFEAAKHGQSEVVKLLIDAKASLKIKKNKSLLHLAGESGDIKTVQLLLEAKSSIGTIDKNGNTDFHCAVMGGNKDIIKLFLSAHAYSPLLQGFLFVTGVSSLFRGISPFDVPNKMKFTPLKYAIFQHDYEVIEYLLKAKADSQVKSLKSDIFFSNTIEKASFELIERLVKLKANVNSIDFKDNNPVLNKAIILGRTNVVKLLIESKADLTKNVQGKTPLDLAKENNCDEIIKLINDVPKNTPSKP